MDPWGNLAVFRRQVITINTGFVESEETAPISRETVAIGLVFLVLVLGFMVGSLWWWCSRRGDGGSIPDYGTSGDGSVPDSRKPGRKQSIPLGSPEAGTDITVSGGSGSGSGSGGSAGVGKTHSLTPQEVLQKYDANHDGVIDKQELMEIVKDARLIGDTSNHASGNNSTSNTNHPHHHPHQGADSPLPDSPPPAVKTKSMIANEHNRNLLREDDDDPKPSDDGVNDIKFDL